MRDPIVEQLTQGITPEKIALTLAVASAFGLFPIVGVTAILCFIGGVTLRLNQPLMQLINQALWPIHLPAIYGCVRLGEAMFGAPHSRFNLRVMSHLLWHSPETFFHQFGLTVMYAIVAWAVVTPFYIPIIYFTLLPVARRVAVLSRKVEHDQANDSTS